MSNATVTELLSLVPLGLQLLGVPAPIVAAVAAAKDPLEQLIEDLLEKKRTGAPLPTLLVPEPVRDLDIVSDLGVSPAAETLPPPAGRPTEPQASLEGDHGWGPSEQPTVNQQPKKDSEDVP